MDLKATLETRVSKKNGQEYQVIIIELPFGLKKQVFLEEAEKKLLEVAKKNAKEDNLDMPDFLR